MTLPLGLKEPPDGPLSAPSGGKTKCRTLLGFSQRNVHFSGIPGCRPVLPSPGGSFKTFDQEQRESKKPNSMCPRPPDPGLCHFRKANSKKLGPTSLLSN